MKIYRYDDLVKCNDALLNFKKNEYCRVHNVQISTTTEGKESYFILVDYVGREGIENKKLEVLPNVFKNNTKIPVSDGTGLPVPEKKVGRPKKIKLAE